MICDEKINITINSRNLIYYRSKNYNVSVGDSIVVNISDLYNGSIYKINIKCDNCGSEKYMEYRLYNNNLKKYGKYYCNKCKHIKSKLTKLELYGDENYNNIEKNKKTCIERYGVEHFNKLDNFKEKIKKTKLKLYGDEKYNNIEKCRKTKLELYGDENYNNIEKNKKTCIKKYNVSSVFYLDKIKMKSFDTRKNRLINLYKKYNLIDINYDKYLYICKCDKNHIFEIPKTIFYNRIKTKNTLCTICNPIGLQSSDKENIIYDFIKDNYDGEIVKNNKNIINPLELDIYIPDLKIGFEFNGLYWHNELYKPNNYHLNKTELCEQKGIKLIHVFEDDWVYKQDIVKSRILNILNKTNNIIFARKCQLREINNNRLIKDFLEKNHIQGFAGSKVKLGLYYNNELVSLMTFGNLRKSLGNKRKEKTYELIRFCNKLNSSVIGGASKLFKYFKNNYNPNEVITYADRSWSQGDLYKKLGFVFIEKTSPNYYYVVDNFRYHRFNFRKDKLIKEGYDKNKTEHEIMLERKIYRIYDSGNLKYNYKI